MKTFTHQEVEKFIRATITETAKGVFDWFEHETNVVDKTTKEILDNTAEIDIKEGKKGILKEYIYPRLEKHGIIINSEKFTENTEPDSKLIDSMAMRYRHDFGLLSEDEQNAIRTTMKQIWEEVVGLGFYKKNYNE
jgi:hypothetical protein